VQDTAGSGQQQQQLQPHEALVAAWLDHKGRLNQGLWRSLVKRVMGLVLRNPGIPEPLLLAQLDVISPAAVKQLLGILQDQGHLLVRPVSVPAAYAGVDASDAAAAAAAGSYATGVLSQGAALRLGTGLAGCAAATAKPPSFLARRKVDGTGTSTTDVARLQQHQLVQHYWPSLTSSTTCCLTCMPPDAVMSA
jgi:hypothetical protein